MAADSSPAAEAWTSVPADVPASLAALLDAGIARRLRVVPLAREADAFVVLAAESADAELGVALARALGAPVRIRRAEPAALDRLIARTYGSDGDRVGRAEGGPADADAGEVRRTVDTLLVRAVRERASDLHIESFGDALHLRMRVDGVLAPIEAPPAAWAAAMISRIKVLAGLDLAETRRPQDGRLRVRVGGREVDLRVATLPTQHGESVVLRVLAPPGGGRGARALGMPERIWCSLLAAVEQPHGLLVVAGPTGSGKTTTLYALLAHLNTPERKILTVEDPVEYEIAGVTQVAAAPHVGCSFPTVLRAFLRHDPDVVLVGEIRDAETAQVAVQAALTGHLVLTTLHAHDTVGAVARLLDLGVEPYLIAAALRGVLAQRLLPRLCGQCRQRCAEDVSGWPELGVDLPRASWRADGCPACDHRGRQGRQGIFEWLEGTADVRRAIGPGPGGHAYHRLRPRPEQTLRADAAGRVEQGEVSLAEARAAF